MTASRPLPEWKEPWQMKDPSKIGCDCGQEFPDLPTFEQHATADHGTRFGDFGSWLCYVPPSITVQKISEEPNPYARLRLIAGNVSLLGQTNLAVEVVRVYEDVQKDSMRLMLKALRRVHEFHINHYWKPRNGHTPTFSEVLLMFEREKAEMLKVEEGKHPEPFLNEMWDSIFAFMCFSLSPDKEHFFSDEDIIQSYRQNLEKIAQRAKFSVFPKEQEPHISPKRDP